MPDNSQLQNLLTSVQLTAETPETVISASTFSVGVMQRVFQATVVKII